MKLIRHININIRAPHPKLDHLSGIQSVPTVLKLSTAVTTDWRQQIEPQLLFDVDLWPLVACGWDPKPLSNPNLVCTCLFLNEVLLKGWTSIERQIISCGYNVLFKGWTCTVRQIILSGHSGGCIESDESFVSKREQNSRGSTKGDSINRKRFNLRSFANTVF